MDPAARKHSPSTSASSLGHVAENALAFATSLDVLKHLENHAKSLREAYSRSLNLGTPANPLSLLVPKRVEDMCLAEGRTLQEVADETFYPLSVITEVMDDGPCV